MAANNSPIFTKQPNIGFVGIGTTSAQVKSDGTSAGTGTDLMYNVWTAGANGSFLERVRFMPVASAAAVNSVATTLRVYLSTVANPAAAGTTNSNTWLIGEISSQITSASNSTQAVTPLDVILNMVVPTGYYVHVSQHIAQTTNQRWNAQAIGGDY